MRLDGTLLWRRLVWGFVDSTGQNVQYVAAILGEIGWSEWWRWCRWCRWFHFVRCDRLLQLIVLRSTEVPFEAQRNDVSALLQHIHCLMVGETVQ
uniref:Putative secreted protein n=1 Tax=Anopheles marajoara TaxID=58244 RepID=A0A2M4C9P3_9DIPT